MKCADFMVKRDKTKWRNVKPTGGQESAQQTYFGVDTETRVDTLLQHNLSLLDWIKKNQGFPYFVGRRINGDDPLTNEEIDFIKANGSTVIPIMRMEGNKNGEDIARDAIRLLGKLELKEQMPVFLEIGEVETSSNFLMGYAKTMLDHEFTPGFFADTDSFFGFDRQFSRAYQADAELMQQCKIWALAPEMEEFFETRDAHTEKPSFWGPFAPSCISREQIMFWQYGKKAHPVNSYAGKRTDFNLNMTNEPSAVFDVVDARVLTLSVKKSGKYCIEACVTDGQFVESVEFDCDVITAKSDCVLNNNKTYAYNIVSEHKILEFTICSNNDLLNNEYVVTEDSALVKLAFVSRNASRVYFVRHLVAYDDYEALRSAVNHSSKEDNLDEIMKISSQEYWGKRFFNKSKKSAVVTATNETNEDSQPTIKYFSYAKTGQMHEESANPKIRAISSITGDRYYLFDTIPQNAVKIIGLNYATICDTNIGRPELGYVVDTAPYSNNKYYSSVALFDLQCSTTPVSDNSANKRVVEFECEKAYDAFVYYYLDRNEIDVIYSDSDGGYVVSTNSQIAMSLVGCHTAYMEKCSFKVSLGGGGNAAPDFMDNVLSVLGHVFKSDSLPGKLVSKVSYVADFLDFLNDVADVITNFNYNSKAHEYAFHPVNNLVTKYVGSTFKPATYKQHWLLKMRGVLDDVTICPDSKILCVFRTNIQREGGSTPIHFYGSYPLQ